MCVGLEDSRAKYKQIIAGGAMIVREFRDFLGKELIPHSGEANYNANKRLYQNRLPVLSERLPVRLAA